MTTKYKKQYKEGDIVWCSKDNGRTFHCGILIGLEFKKDKHLYVVNVTDECTNYVKYPVKDTFIGYFTTIYNKSEMIELLGDK